MYDRLYASFAERTTFPVEYRIDQLKRLGYAVQGAYPAFLRWRALDVSFCVAPLTGSLDFFSLRLPENTVALQEAILTDIGQHPLESDLCQVRPSSLSRAPAASRMRGDICISFLVGTSIILCIFCLSLMLAYRGGA